MKTRGFLLVTVLSVFGCIMNASLVQALTVASTTKLGSLLKAPLATDILIENVYIKDVRVWCIVKDQDSSNIHGGSGIEFQVKARSAEHFYVTDITGGYPAAVDCFVVKYNNLGNHQTSYNYLKGTAFIDGMPYQMWSFAAKVKMGKAVGTPGEIRLTGLSGGYDACPASLHFSLPDGLDFAEATFTLAKEDLRQDRLPVYSKARMVFSPYMTSRYQCIEDITAPFQLPIKNSFSIKGIASTSCAEVAVNSPLFGIVVVQSSGGNPVLILPTGIGVDGTGYILFDPAGPTLQMILF